MSHYDEKAARYNWNEDEQGILSQKPSWWASAIETSYESKVRLVELNSLMYGEGAQYQPGGDTVNYPKGWWYNYERDHDNKMNEQWCLMQFMGPLAASKDDGGEGYGKTSQDGDDEVPYGLDFNLDDFVDANGRHIEGIDFREKYTNNTMLTTGKIGTDYDWVYLYGALEYIKNEKHTEFDGDNVINVYDPVEGLGYSVQVRLHFSSTGNEYINPGAYSLCDAAQRLIVKILKKATDSPYADFTDDDLHAILRTPYDPDGAVLLDVSGEGTDEPTWGITEEKYQELVQAGLAVTVCDDPPPPTPVPEDCPPCVENPDAIVPNWRFKEEGDVFLNGKTCEYCVTVDTTETDATILNNETTREDFLEEQKQKGVNLMLEYFGKEPLDDATMEIVLAAAMPKQYDVPMRPLMPIRVLVCVPVATIDAIQLIESDTTEDEAPPIGPAGCTLMAEDIRTMIGDVREAFRFFGHQYALWSWTTGQYIDNFSPVSESKKLRLFVPALVQLMNRNGFKLNGKMAAEKVEFRFNSEYELIYAQANERNCEPIELIWKKGGDNLGGFKALEPINDPRTMAYIASLVDMHTDAGARDPKAWDEFFTKYTYPPISTDNIEDPLGDPVMADGPLQQAAQSIVNEIVSLPDAIVAKFGEQVCRDRRGQAIHEADLKNFDDMLKRAIDSKTASIITGDKVFLNLSELLELSKGEGVKDLYQNILNKLGVCGLLDLLSMATACLTNGIDLADSLRIIVRAALGGMSTEFLGIIVSGLPPDKQVEVKQKVADAGWDSLPAPWESGYHPGAYSYKVDLNDAGEPIKEGYTITKDDGTVEKIEAEDDDRSIAERTASYRSETQGADYGGAGTIGTAADNTIDAIVGAYIEALMDSVDAEYLLEQINKFPGAELITKILNNPECPPPPLFNPPLKDFMKTLELDFCRGQFDITLPKFQKINIPDFMKMFMEALKEMIMQLVIKIIITILEMILNILLNGLCNLLGMLGDQVAALFGAVDQPTNNFADSIKNSIDQTGLSGLGVPMPLASDDAINSAAADMFASFSRSCQKPEDLPNGEQASDFMNEVGLILTQGEFLDLLTGVAAEEVYKAIYQLVVVRHQSFLCIFPNISNIKDFFRSLGSMVDQSSITRVQPNMPVFSGVCSDLTGAAEVDELRRQLMVKKGLNTDIINELLEQLKCQALSDLEELTKIAQNGPFESMPPLIGDGCTPGILPKDIPAAALPTGASAARMGPEGLFESAFALMDSVYYRDLMGSGGFLNMVLSDRQGRSRTGHNTFVALQSVFGIFSPNPNSHEELLPVYVAKYLEYILKNPGSTMENGYRFLAQTFTPGASPDLILKYSNYYPEDDTSWYRFVLNFTASDYEATTLNNRYRIVLDETFNYSDSSTNMMSSPPSTTFSTETLTERMVIDTDPGLPDGVQDFIENELGLDIESTLNSGNDFVGPEQLSAQAVVFGKYIEKILRDNISEEVLNTGPYAEENLSYISSACMTDVFNYVNTGFFGFLAGTIADDNQAFYYGEGGDDFEGNTPTTFAPAKIFLDETHKHPVTGESIPLDPLAWGGNDRFPAYYEQPPQNRPGWCGISDKFVPEVDACDPKRENVIGFKQISESVEQFHNSIVDDPRLSQPSNCTIEAPCNKILTRGAAALIEGNIKATIRIYVAEAFLKGMPAFIKFKADLSELYGDPMTAYITQTLKDGFFLYSKKGFGRRKNDEYYYQFLEQCVQNFGRKVDAGIIEPTTDEQEAIDTINALQGIWKKDTETPSGKPYADTGERLKRVLSPGFFGAQLKSVFNANYDVPLNEEGGPLSEKEAKKLKEESWDYFMREVESQAEVIVKRYIAEELKYVSDEFSERIPPEYRTLYEIFLGHETFGCFGNLNFEAGSTPVATPSDDANPFSVASTTNVIYRTTAFETTPASTLTNEAINFLVSMGTGTEGRPNPASVLCMPPKDDVADSARYWPFVLEQFIEIEDHADAESSGAPEIWGTTVMLRPDNLFGVVRATDWHKYIQDNSALFSGYTRGDLWKSWKYGLRIIFVPPNPSGDTYPDPKFPFGAIEFDDSNPGTDIAMPYATNIKYRILGMAVGATGGSETFTQSTTERNKAFWFRDTIDGTTSNPASIPLAKGNLAISMDVDCLSDDWITSYDNAGGFTPLVQDLVCSPEYKMLFRYCFNMPRILSVIGIYIIQSFLPSIGRGPDTPSVPQAEWDNTIAHMLGDDVTVPEGARAFDDTDQDDGWYEPTGLKGFFEGEYHGGGLSLFPFPITFKNWNYNKAFNRTKKMAAQSFMDTYNSQDPTYTSEATGDMTNQSQDDAKNNINVSWPKFNIRLWSKEVDRPYDKNGDICYNPEDDYSD